MMRCADAGSLDDRVMLPGHSCSRGAHEESLGATTQVGLAPGACLALACGAARGKQRAPPPLPNPHHSSSYFSTPHPPPLANSVLPHPAQGIPPLLPSSLFKEGSEPAVGHGGEPTRIHHLERDASCRSSSSRRCDSARHAPGAHQHRHRNREHDHAHQPRRDRAPARRRIAQRERADAEHGAEPDRHPAGDDPMTAKQDSLVRQHPYREPIQLRPIRPARQRDRCPQRQRRLGEQERGHDDGHGRGRQQQPHVPDSRRARTAPMPLAGEGRRPVQAVGCDESWRIPRAVMACRSSRLARNRRDMIVPTGTFSASATSLSDSS